MEENLKVIQPQEIEAWYVLPLIRKELALAMKQEGLDQKTIAKSLGVTAAAVSQYVNNKRGNDYSIDSHLKHEFTNSAKIIVKDSSLIFAEVQRLLKLLWNEGIVCKIHREKSWHPNDKECGVCFEND
ncbi:helix-turn-helix domain-containing protein [Candidatus Woesearchaeota archaeon]|jgi:predicted transcriptional regulator|nr:helix-turn-helix domain-containing protein [Candidatus Woesearchaeota archaeon]MBT5215451.1 helix-turn-helix domain-containing protein [Candidatus Woesearchaeota archaeon]MBT6402177.1 helix-turn-helix domain-containing protein [Candidatus Woesearchaeota archaeon]